MPLLDSMALLAGVIAVLALVNARYLKLPSSIGVTVGGLLLSLGLIALNALEVPLARQAVAALRIDFNTFVFQGVLSFLLFAGALGVNSHALWSLRWPVATLALLSTAVSTALVGGLVYGLLRVFGMDVPFVFCLLFGALISPTDPVAVLGMLKQAKVPRRIETLVAGESLFNDGIGVVAFAVLAGIAAGGAGHGAGTGALDVLLYFVQEAAGGLLLGAALGAVGYVALKSVNDFVTEMLVSLGLVLGLTALAFHLHTSAPLAAVAAGLLVGALTDRVPGALSSREEFEHVWHLIDEVLNVCLFALLAVQIVAVPFSGTALLLGVIATAVVLLSRALSVQVSVTLLRRVTAFAPFTRRLLVWGGLRGAISVALAFTLPAGPERDVFLVMTYVVVVFSIIVQGLTVGRLAARAGAALPAERPTPER
ncbi:CPA1 family monovalent cation:H+ antiporter [Deinococcus metalli]|uniref:CPA1 family monovalent cation:H+ antiporter n=1 Tax=Deinococcus metalli TaxID=1141878 RepID=A0A7W8KGF6_9DEIO|nr:sodium:proton antiporter [Deinococcus metalli]MBB5377635.1 CPA1 family monovalent cation:H+ antiporter [Deinococcus metalli]GHF52208.1 sodium:proton antiporter [Deinococcus metalli]